MLWFLSCLPYFVYSTFVGRKRAPEARERKGERKRGLLLRFKAQTDVLCLAWRETGAGSSGKKNDWLPTCFRPAARTASHGSSHEPCAIRRRQWKLVGSPGVVRGVQEAPSLPIYVAKKAMQMLLQHQNHTKFCSYCGREVGA